MQPDNHTKLSVDIDDYDDKGRLRLDGEKARRSIEANGVVLEPGMRLLLVDWGYRAIGYAEWSPEDGIWLAVLDPDSLRECDPELDPTYHDDEDVSEDQGSA